MASLERLKQLNEYDSENSFNKTGVTAKDQEFNESELFDSIFKSISQIHTSERTIALPGMADSRNLIRGAVKKFAREVQETNFRPPQEAGVDDVTMQQIRPETFGENDFDNTGLTGGNTTQIVDDGSSNPVSLDDDEWVIVTDLVEYSSDTPISAIQHTIDGEPKEAEELAVQYKDSDLQIYPLISPEFAKENYQLEGKVQDDGDSELAPLGVHIAKGDLVGDLT